MTDKQKSQVTDAGAVALEEGQLDDAQGGIIAVSPANTVANKFSDNVTQKVVDGGAVKLGDGSVKQWKL